MILAPGLVRRTLPTRSLPRQGQARAFTDRLVTELTLHCWAKFRPFISAGSDPPLITVQQIVQ